MKRGVYVVVVSEGPLEDLALCSSDVMVVEMLASIASVPK